MITLNNKLIVFFLFLLSFSPSFAVTVDFTLPGCYTGAAVSWQTVNDGHSWITTKADINEFERMIGRKLAIVHYYKAFAYNDQLYEFPKDFYQTTAQNGSILFLTWEPRDWDTTSPNYFNVSLLPDIIAGKYDAYIDRWANEIKVLDRPVLLRFAHEMNLNNYSWTGFKNGGENGGSETYIKAYRHVHDRFAAAGVQNVQWIWTPIKWGLPFEPWNFYANYYPGDEYVDVIAMDEYNWGTSQPWSSWKSFNETYWQLYSELIHLYPNKPLIIGEFASVDQGGDKAKWITEAFSDIQKKYPKIKAFVWFHIDNRGQTVNNMVENGDGRIDSSPGCAEAAKTALASEYFVERVKLAR